jgi:transposase-like protein
MTADLLNPIFLDEELARQHLEALRWANGRSCPHCGTLDESGYVESKNHKAGLYHCNACAKTFTVTVGTLFERSHIPLNKWLMAFHLFAASKKGMSAKQLERMLGISYKSAWFMAHRIREAMTSEPAKMLGGPGSSGVVEADETYWGQKRDASGKKSLPKSNSAGRDKMKILSLVERDGQKRSFAIPNVNASTLAPIMKAHIDSRAFLMTDELHAYKSIGQSFAGHESVAHSKKEYVRGKAHNNTAESSFNILKRGLIGTFHSVSEKHLQRYVNEFDFRWNTRQSLGFNDSQRAQIALKGITGKRLTYRRTAGEQNAQQAV